MTTVPLSLLDELFLGLDDDEEPWGVHVEARVGGRLDADRVAGALAAAVRRHPLARARLADWHDTDWSYHWKIADELAEVPLAIDSCRDDAELAAARERWFAVSPSLDAAPPFALLLAHAPDGDSLLLNLHHAAGDGVGAFRLLRSILLAYAGEDDPGPAVDPLAVRDVRALTRARSVAERRARSSALARAAADQVVPAARIAREGGAARPGYGFELLPFSTRETEAIIASRPSGATVNDLLLAALAVTIQRWNAAHGRPTARIALTMPVNLRPAAWRTDVVGNFAAYATISVAAGDADELGTAVGAVSATTNAAKRDGVAGLVVDELVVPGLLAIAGKRRLQNLIPLTGDVVVDTATLSNVGALDGLPKLGDDAGEVERVWFSPPMRMPLGAALGAVTVAGRLHVTMRYRHPQFGAQAAGAFAGLYRGVLLAGIGVRSTRSASASNW